MSMFNFQNNCGVYKQLDVTLIFLVARGLPRCSRTFDILLTFHLVRPSTPLPNMVDIYTRRQAGQPCLLCLRRVDPVVAAHVANMCLFRIVFRFLLCYLSVQTPKPPKCRSSDTGRFPVRFLCVHCVLKLPFLRTKKRDNVAWQTDAAAGTRVVRKLDEHLVCQLQQARLYAITCI